MLATINGRVLMSDAGYFDSTGLNPLSDVDESTNLELARSEHQGIRDAMTLAGISVVQVEAPDDCPDGVYAANWGLCIDDAVVFSRLPRQREAEGSYVRQLFLTDKRLRRQFNRLIDPPYLFSGQGDALVCGDYIFCGQGYRTDPRMHGYLARIFPDKRVVSLQTVPLLDDDGSPVINPISGLADSYFYDLDLAFSILGPGIIAWCVDAFTPESQTVIRNLAGFKKIEVAYDEAVTRFACNLISTGETVVMSAGAPKFQAAIEAAGLKTVTPPVRELAKGGGYIRCVSLTLDNN